MHYVYPEFESKKDVKQKILKFRLSEIQQESLINVLRYNQNSSQECRIMMDYIFENKCRKILELGVSQGFSTVPLLIIINHVKGRLVSIDNVDYQKNVEELAEKLNVSLKRWKFICQNDLELEPDKYDMIFLDTSHDYNQTMKELNKFSEFSDAIFCHDYNQNGVRWAVQDFLKDNDWRLTGFNTCCGLCLIERRG